jgi:hypothetical protein
MRSHRWHNVRADQCSVSLGTNDSSVRYQGGEYAVVGVYLASAARGRPSLCYVLRDLEGDERGREIRGPRPRGMSST